MPLATGDHTARVAAALGWLESLCGDYAPLRRRFIAAYFRFVTSLIEARRTELVERLKPYDGLYAPEDFLWSALRPLPRGWVPVADKCLPADMVFWDGTRAIAFELGARNTDRQKALLTAGVAVHRIDPAMMENALPDDFGRFWQSQVAAIEPVPPASTSDFGLCLTLPNPTHKHQVGQRRLVAAATSGLARLHHRP